MKKKVTMTAAMFLIVAMSFMVGCNKPDDDEGQQNGNSDVRVTTYTPQDITQISAVCGGDVIVTQGVTLNELGVCWSTNNKPTIEDAHLHTTNWSEPYVCIITGLEPGTTYHVRAYVLCGLEYYYGEDKSFTTEENGGGGGSGGNGSFNGHDYVNLGLPSGTLWATCNVGATTPENYGDYFAWGETGPKGTYSWNTYKYANGTTSDIPKLTKYCNNSSYGNNFFTDNLTVLQPSDDAATVNWGSGWRMPTHEEWVELYENTTNTWTTRNGVDGWLFTASNGNSLFLPAAGSRCFDELFHAGLIGYYWSSSLGPGHPSGAWTLVFHQTYFGFDGSYARSGGLPVRPVHEN